MAQEVATCARVQARATTERIPICLRVVISSAMEQGTLGRIWAGRQDALRTTNDHQRCVGILVSSIHKSSSRISRAPDFDSPLLLLLSYSNFYVWKGSTFNIARHGRHITSSNGNLVYYSSPIDQATKRPTPNAHASTLTNTEPRKHYKAKT